ncbi:hypothetical protein HZH68_016540 [Vespula germanica]|uniref:Uncharacterized protein n=1 Tax=Vespula germanica TaxID=30212 RepID=A0A834MQ64_VESGE|nr:hypothetical protein HZH68_016540 [Vespula germanica]
MEGVGTVEKLEGQGWKRGEGFCFRCWSGIAPATAGLSAELKYELAVRSNSRENRDNETDETALYKEVDVVVVGGGNNDEENEDEEEEKEEEKEEEEEEDDWNVVVVKVK